MEKEENQNISSVEQNQNKVNETEKSDENLDEKIKRKLIKNLKKKSKSQPLKKKLQN